MSINNAGDLLTSGDIASPSGGQVLLDSGSISPDFSIHGYADINVTLNSSVAMIFTIGVYASNDAPIHTFTYGTSSGVGANIELKRVPFLVGQGQKFKVVAATGSVGTVNVALNIAIIDGD